MPGVSVRMSRRCGGVLSSGDMWSPARPYAELVPDRNDQLRAKREELFAEFESIADPRSLWHFQRRLAEEIIATEPTAFADRESPERRHLRLLRFFGDGLAWRFARSPTTAASGSRPPTTPRPPPARLAPGDASV